MTGFIIILSAGIFFAILLYAIYRKAFYSPNKYQNDIYNIPTGEQYDPYRQRMLDLIDDLNSRSFEEVQILSYDGLKLYGRYYHYQDGAPLDIAFHGYRGTAIRDMCGGIWLSYATKHNILLVDQRAHGRSKGHTITFGIKERKDCVSWVDYAKGRFGDNIQILLYGVSMGAATVLMASSEIPVKNVYGIIADCPYSSPKEIIKKVCKDMKYPPKLAYPFIALSARVFGRFKVTEITAEEAVKVSSVPILILHGDDDRFVPEEMSKSISNARDGIERHTFSGAAHGISGIVHTDQYNEIVLHFIENCIQGANACNKPDAGN